MPILLASSVTPIYGSNPSLRIIQYHPVTGCILDYETYYMDLKSTTNDNHSAADVWIEAERFARSFQVPDLRASSLQAIRSQLLAEMNFKENKNESASVWETLLSRQNVYASPESSRCLDVACRREWICTLSSIDAKQYQNCLYNHDVDYWPWSRRILVVLLLLGIGMVVLRSSVRRLRRRSYDLPNDAIVELPCPGDDADENEQENGNENYLPNLS